MGGHTKRLAQANPCRSGDDRSTSTRIAVIGWGSLIWEPKELDVEPTWHTDGPMLPVEFARVSSRNRLTLVLRDNVPLQPTLWALSHKNTLLEAIKDLAKREETPDSNIGRWPCQQTGGECKKRVLSIIAEWACHHTLDGVVWTALGPKKPSEGKGVATDQELIEYLHGLVEHDKAAAAKEYVEKAPSQIQTPLRARIGRELGWGRRSRE